MSLEILKKGQGRYVRWTAYLMGAALVAFGALRLYALINVPFEESKAGPIERFFHVSGVPLIGELSIYRIVAVLVGLFGILAIHLFLNRNNTVDLLIDTEQELRKVSWPSRREVQNATVVVVIVTMTLALLLAGFDTVLEYAFRLVYGA
jgi:preprotein translocase subunit SecE